jgi:hypothetical protein
MAVCAANARGVDDSSGPDEAGRDVAVIAARLQAANLIGFGAGRAAVCDHLAENVEIRHVPVLSTDGSWTRDEFAAQGRAEDTAFRAAMTDFRQESVRTTVDGNEITVHRTLCGTAADGTAVRVPLVNVYTVVDGLIRSIVPHMAEADLVTLRRVFSAGELDAASMDRTGLADT